MSNSQIPCAGHNQRPGNALHGGTAPCGSVCRRPLLILFSSLFPPSSFLALLLESHNYTTKLKFVTINVIIYGDMANAEIVCIGTELLLGQKINTNSAYISCRLKEAGINVYYHTIVGDNPERLLSALKLAV